MFKVNARLDVKGKAMPSYLVRLQEHARQLHTDIKKVKLAQLGLQASEFVYYIKKGETTIDVTGLQQTATIGDLKTAVIAKDSAIMDVEAETLRFKKKILIDEDITLENAAIGHDASLTVVKKPKPKGKGRGKGRGEGRGKGLDAGDVD